MVAQASGGRGRWLWPVKETIEAKCLPIPESTRAEPGGKPIWKSREKAFLTSPEQGQSTGPGCGFDSLDDPRKAPALLLVGL